MGTVTVTYSYGFWRVTQGRITLMFRTNAEAWASARENGG
jgi:hypothetical protein